MVDDVVIPIQRLNPDYEHSFQKMLRGITPTKIDQHGHFTVPRSVDGVYIATHDTEDHDFYYLCVYSVPAWNSLQSKTAKLWADDEERKFHEFRRSTANQADLLIENQLAIGLPQKHLDYAGITGEALIVGQDDCFLVMNQNSLRQSMQDDFDYDMSSVWPL